MKRIEFIVSSKPDKPEFGYGDHFTVVEDGVTLLGGHGSTCPNPFLPSNSSVTYEKAYGWISLGTYKYLYLYHPKFGHCLLLNEGKAVGCRYPNPNKESKYYGERLMNEIFVHKGGIKCSNPDWRGSSGCITVSPREYDAFISLFHPGDKGEIELKEFIEKEKPVAEKKSPFKSKTLWFNILAMAVTVGIKAVEKMSGTDILPVEVATVIVAVGNFVLRFLTETKIG